MAVSVMGLAPRQLVMLALISLGEACAWGLCHLGVAECFDQLFDEGRNLALMLQLVTEVGPAGFDVVDPGTTPSQRGIIAPTDAGTPQVPGDRRQIGLELEGSACAEILDDLRHEPIVCARPGSP